MLILLLLRTRLWSGYARVLQQGNTAAQLVERHLEQDGCGIDVEGLCRLSVALKYTRCPAARAVASCGNEIDSRPGEVAGHECMPCVRGLGADPSRAVQLALRRDVLNDE